MTIHPTPKPPPLFETARSDAHAADVRRAEERLDHAGAAKAEAMRRVQAELVRFIRVLGIGERFQGVDFMRRCEERGIEWAPLDPRALGPLLNKLKSVGVIRAERIQPTGGLPSRNCNSSPRIVYVIETAALDPLGWEAA